MHRKSSSSRTICHLVNELLNKSVIPRNSRQRALCHFRSSSSGALPLHLQNNFATWLHQRSYATALPNDCSFYTSAMRTWRLIMTHRFPQLSLDFVKMLLNALHHLRFLKEHTATPSPPYVSALQRNLPTYRSSGRYWGTGKPPAYKSAACLQDFFLVQTVAETSVTQLIPTNKNTLRHNRLRVLQVHLYSQPQQLTPVMPWIWSCHFTRDAMWTYALR